jgi:hypothetical protein
MSKPMQTAAIRCAVALGLISLLTAAPQAGAQTPATVAPPAQTTAGVNDAFSSTQWPMQVPTPDGQVTVFEPQLEDFQGDTLKARAAVSVAQPAGQSPLFGAIWLDSRVATDRVTRTVRVLDVNITRDRFPSIDPRLEGSLVDAIKQALNANPPTLSLDQLLAMVETVQKEQTTAADLQTAPPAIVFKDHPAVKVQYDGAPKLVAAAGTGTAGLLRVVNTPFFVVLDPPQRLYFLKGGGRWFSAPDPLGPFHDASGRVPPEVSALADSNDYKDPQQPVSDAEMARLEIVTATTPTELIWTDGQPQMGTLPGTDLLYVTNTDADWFITIDTQQNFLLISGRWYAAPNQNGPWAFVPPDKLPEVFQKIPPNSDKGDVLAQIAGTQAAKDALADAAVPQTAEIDRSTFQQPDIHYDGDPQFQPVAPNIDCTYAVNTNGSILCTGGQYYCCYNGCWYQSADPRGHWGLCIAVPPVFYTIPPSCPLYPVRYCYVYGYTPEFLYCGYLPGYVGSYVYDGCIVYGTGYSYHPWWGHTYYPRPWTYGFAAHYNSYVGHWGFDFGLATGGGGIWVGQGDRAWGRHDDWFGYGGYRPAVVHNQVTVNLFRAQYLNRVRPESERPANAAPKADIYSRNVYERRPDVRPVIAAGPAVNLRVEHPDLQRDKTVHIESPHSPAQHLPEIDRGADNNVFADHQGNVYRRTDQGWEIHDQTGWQSHPIDQTYHTMGPEAGADHVDHADRQNPDHPNGAAAADHRAAVEPQHDQPMHNETERGNPGARESSAPPARGDQDIARDYGARVEGEQRFSNYQRSAAPPQSQSRQESPGPGQGPGTGQGPGATGGHDAHR